MTEFGPWLWTLAGLFFVFLEIFIARGIALSLGLASILTGTMAVLGASGVVPKSSLEAQIGVFLLLLLAFVASIRRIAKQN